MKFSFLQPVLCFTLIVQGVLCSTADIYSHLATKTPYRFIANKNDSPIEFEGCEPVKVWMVLRHGTRYPSKGFIEEMTATLPIIKAQILNNKNPDKQLNSSELQKISRWNGFVNVKDEKKLAHEGEEEMINLAERMQSRFPTLFPKIYSNSSYKFRFTNTQRTKESAKYFSIGLFGRRTSSSVWFPKPSQKDPILRFYKLCDKWLHSIKNNPKTYNERRLFEEGSEMKNILKKISSKIGIENELTFHDALIMYMTCAFETSWFKNSPSPWCFPFSNETIQVMEYAEDLKYYWVDGYGYKLTYLQACPAIKNLVEFFKRKEEYPKTVLYFTHSGTILKLLAHFGLYKDKNTLRHDNFRKQQNRLWRVSKIDSFASNIAIVKYRCGTKDKILALHQERIVNIVGSTKLGLCDFDKFLTKYHDSLNCNFEQMCSIR